MFGTFKYNETTNSHEFIDISDQPPQSTSTSGVDPRGYTRTACDLCRSRKLKCSGDKDCCERCQSAGRICSYAVATANASSSRRKRKASSPIPRPELKDDQSGVEGDTVTKSRNQSISQAGFSRQSPTNSTEAPDDNLLLPDLTSFDDAWSNIDVDIDWDSLGILENEASLNRHDDMQIQTPISPVSMKQKIPSTIDQSRATSSTDRHQSSMPWTFSGSNSSLREQQELSTFETLTASSPAAKECKCLNSMVKLLEHIGTLGSVTAIDTHLMCVNEGIIQCRVMLSCPFNCSTCTDHSTLVATIGQQLYEIWTELGRRFLLHHHDFNGGTSKAKNSTDQSSGGDYVGVFWFGRYNVECPSMRLSLIRCLIVLHFRDLRDLLAQLKICAKWKGSLLTRVTDAEERATKINQIIQQ